MTITGTSLATDDRTAAVAYGLSHDLRARLRAAGGFLELARADLEDGTETAHFLDRAATAASLADRMTERLVRYLRIEPAIAPVTASPAELIAQAVLHCPSPPETVIEPLPDVTADPDLLVDAIVEILDNADRFRSDDRPPIVRISGEIDERWSVLRFVDNGIGIDADRVDRAFELFRQVHRAGSMSSSGMGLPIARRIIESQEGTISLGPDPEGGAAVEIRLPAPSAS